MSLFVLSYFSEEWEIGLIFVFISSFWNLLFVFILCPQLEQNLTFLYNLLPHLKQNIYFWLNKKSDTQNLEQTQLGVSATDYLFVFRSEYPISVYE